ncbi:peptidase M16 domain protein [Desulforamulus reducens MI-1]|uniref:Peptidase M16 domain protein n=1 Tax=Desulforamulus reducens (strain ATCC BAA-1160 / DSM 100696 / MI-1) TaxID=349161 RepID=A4J5W3_DESRM|nr:pitrilysin family protein [Desulforamulus reducens]ABO50466.1 peptidase M16 domain protein [Desulforamulus reducens MI-1]
MFYQKEVLPNGVRILTQQVSHVRSVAMGIWVDVGSRDESDETAGISHYIEHMMFKGTKHRTPKQIAEELDAVGGQLNAFTTKEYTCYYAKVLDEHFNLAVDVLTDMLFHSNISELDVEREKNVILEEIKMYEDAPDELVHDMFAKTIWAGHPLGRPIIGTTETVSSFSYQDLRLFMKENYAPNRIVVSVSGNITHQQVINKLAPLFGNMSGNQVRRQLEKPTHSIEVNCRSKETEQVHMVIGAPGLRLDDDSLYIAQVINTVLGGGLSSRLFQEIREQRGLVYSVYSYHSSYHDTGIFGVYAGLSKQNVNNAMELIFKEIKDIKQNGISQKELQRAKDQLKGNLLLSLESVNTHMSRLGKSELYLGKVYSPEEIVEKLNRVTLEDTVRVAEELFQPDKFSMAAIGPWQDCGDLKKVLETLKD